MAFIREFIKSLTLLKTRKMTGIRLIEFGMKVPHNPSLTRYNKPVFVIFLSPKKDQSKVHLGFMTLPHFKEKPTDCITFLLVVLYRLHKLFMKSIKLLLTPELTPKHCRKTMLQPAAISWNESVETLSLSPKLSFGKNGSTQWTSGFLTTNK